METIEEYWENCAKNEYIREERNGKAIYRLRSHIGEGGFEIWGDPTTVMATLLDSKLHKPTTFIEHVNERYLQFSQFYTGKAEFYQKRSEVYPIELGLNYFVHRTPLFGYKKVPGGERIVDVGIFYRSKFFDTLPFDLPEDFWEVAASVLNPDVITLPPITMICEQIRNCRLEGNELKMFIYGKALEAFSITLNYIYTHRKVPPVHLSFQDKAALESIKPLLQEKLLDPPSIETLATALGMNQRKLMAGFKYLNGITIYGYLKHLRMEKAAELLREDQKNILEIARAVGYHGDGHFQSAFKEVYGTTPSKFRKEIGRN